MPVAQRIAPLPEPDRPAVRTVRRRTVLYLSGFDPQGPGHYHALYRNEGLKQAGVSGYALDVGERRRLDALISEWRVHFESTSGEVCSTRFRCLRWDDIVRRHWPRHGFTVWAITVANTWQLLRNGSLWRMLQTSWPAFLALTLPGMRLLGLVAGGFAILGGLWWLREAPLPGLLAGLVIGLAGLGYLSRRLEKLAQGDWLMRSARVILAQARQQVAELDERTSFFAEHLHRTLLDCEEDEEVLVVGHSSGAMLAVSITAQALRKLPAGSPARERLGLLTLGECIPVLSYQPEAQWFRDDLQTLRSATDLAWLDVTAPPDACCFALIDPTEVCLDGGPHPASTDCRHLGPKRISARFVQMFDPSSYKLLRRDKHRCHFQYLMAADRPSDYDYFLLTSGAQAFKQTVDQHIDVAQFRQFQRFGSPAR